MPPPRVYARRDRVTGIAGIFPTVGRGHLSENPCSTRR